MKTIFSYLLCMCIAFGAAVGVTAQEEDAKCLIVRSMKAKCGALTADGKRIYEVSFHLADIIEGADVVHVSSNTGRVGTSSFVLPFANPEQHFRYLPVTNDGKACFTFTLYELTEDGRRRLCRVEYCIELPKCEIKCSEVKKKLRSGIRQFENTEDVLLEGMLSIVPAGVEWFTINVVEAKHITRCSNAEGAEWERLTVRPTRAVLTDAASPNINPEIVSWKFDPCFRMTNRKFKVLFDLPAFCPPPGEVAVKCVDTAIICVKYSFKLCDGPRCDTTVCYTVVRRCESRPASTDSETKIESHLGTVGQLNSLDSDPSLKVLTVHPNPVFSEVTISVQSPSADANATLEIANMNGGVMYSSGMGLSQGKNEVVVGTGNLATGLYTVRVRGAWGSVSQTLQVVR